MKIFLENDRILVRQTQPADFAQMKALSMRVYPGSPPWELDQLASHLKVFPEGQLVAVEKESDRIVGMASSLIVKWSDYDMNAPWRNFTDTGFFTNHDPEEGKTLYGAEVMVDTQLRGQGIGKLLYEGRRQITDRLRLPRIRAGARMRGYAVYADQMTPVEYLGMVVNAQIFDPTVSFQIRQGFKALAVVADYLRHDPESLGYAAIIEWLNPKYATREDIERQKELVLETFGRITSKKIAY